MAHGLRSRLWLVCSTIAIAASICGCDGKDASKPEVVEKTLRLGVVTSLTGDTASWGEMQRNATILAVEDINENGGLGNKKVEAVFEDDQGSPKVAVTAFKKLLATTQLPIVVGFPLSGSTLAASETANREKKVLLSSGSTATAVGKAGPYVFRIMPSDETQAALMADWALELGYRKVAVLYVENAWGAGLKDNFIKIFSEKGGKIVQLESSTDGMSDFRAQLTKIKGVTPDAIYLPLYQREAGLAIRQARQLDISQQVLGADVYGTPELLEAGGDAVEGVLYATFSAGHGALYKDFAKRYVSRFGSEPGTYAAYSYDAFRLAAEALNRAGGAAATGERARQILLEIKEYNGVTGLTSFDGSNSATGKTFEKMVIKDGKFVPLQNADRNEKTNPK